MAFTRDALEGILRRREGASAPDRGFRAKGEQALAASGETILRAVDRVFATSPSVFRRLERGRESRARSRHSFAAVRGSQAERALHRRGRSAADAGPGTPRYLRDAP